MKIAIAGAAGRMGTTLIRELQYFPEAFLSGALERAGSPASGEDAGTCANLKPLGVAIGTDAEKILQSSDAIIDFTSPESTLAIASLAAKHRKIHIIGTTGMTAEHMRHIEEYAKQAIIVKAANMSLGVNLLQALVEKTASILGEDFDIEIVEMHHKHKVDAPSGTALALGESAASGRNVALKEASVRVRDGITGPREAGTIGFATLRGGDVVGDHTVIFAGEGERIELTHKASDRRIFARGAIRAALWAKGKKPALYSMKDVLGL